MKRLQLVNNLTLRDVNRALETQQRINDELFNFYANQAVLFYDQHVPGTCYPKNALVIVEGRYLMIARTQTCQDPTITPDGPAGWLSGLPDPSTGWSYYSGATFNTKSRGVEVTMPTGDAYAVNRLRMLVPHDANTQEYILRHQEFSPALGTWSTDVVTRQFASTNKGAWLYFAYNALWRPGSTHRVWLDIISTAQPTTFSARWQQLNTNSAPNAGEATFANSQNSIQFHVTDLDGGNQLTNMSNVPVGATLTRQEDNATWTISAIASTPTAYTFTLSPGGNRGAEGTYTFQFDYGEAALLYHASIADHWAGHPNVSGVLQNNNDAVETTDQLFPTDIEFQPLKVPSDWQLLTNF